MALSLRSIPDDGEYLNHFLSSVILGRYINNKTCCQIDLMMWKKRRKSPGRSISIIVMVSGFGKFYVNEKKEHKGRDPATGENLMLDKRRVITFKCSQGLRKKVDV